MEVISLDDGFDGPAFGSKCVECGVNLVDINSMKKRALARATGSLGSRSATNCARTSDFCGFSGEPIWSDLWSSMCYSRYLEFISGAMLDEGFEED